MTAYCETPKALLKELETDPKLGLTQAEARRRLDERGHNELKGE